jgi:hypothetical protein
MLKTNNELASSISFVTRFLTNGIHKNVMRNIRGEWKTRSKRGEMEVEEKRKKGQREL